MRSIVMRTRRRSLMIFWLVIQLLLGQQLALAHMIGHVGNHSAYASSSAAANAEDDDGHDAPHALAEVCTTCLAVAALDFAVPATAASVLATSAASLSLVIAVSPAPTFARYAPFHSRAPPTLHR